MEVVFTREDTGLSPRTALGRTETVRALARCNEQTAPFGLTLSPEQMETLAEGRFRALRNTGRVEFGGGVLPALILALCDSPDLHQADYAETLLILQEVFYRWKNESGDRLSDGELLGFLRRAFDGLAHGAAEYLAGFSLEELWRRIHEPDEDNGE